MGPPHLRQLIASTLAQGVAGTQRSLRVSKPRRPVSPLSRVVRPTANTAPDQAFRRVTLPTSGGHMTASGLARRQTAPRRRPLRRALITLALLAPLLVVAQPAQAASSKAGENGGYSLFSGRSAGTPVIRATDREVTGTIPAATLGATFRVQGRYNQFVVRASDFALFDYAFTGAPNRLDMTGGRFTPVWESKVPQHRGLSLSSAITVELEDEDLVISRTGTGLSMKIQS